MAVDQELVHEIGKQLQDDILHFGWIRQIASLQHPDYDAAQCVESVMDAVVYLHETQVIVIGDAHESDGVVLIRPWQESGSDLRKRAQFAMSEPLARDRDFCFWIQLTKHFAS